MKTLALAFLALLWAPLSPADRTLRLVWDPAPDPQPSWQYEVWRSFNLADWHLWQTTPGTCLVFSASAPCAFFKVRTIDTNSGEVSEWAR